ncbi:MAG: tRNA uridine-5-carboxymethylaminomethyl(34) synthesis GTPase MnmE [Bacilli bacterium]|nr:tRNA uridine-5-carboxymethylaminomethyl(34) synthesis GTPase MnmE [Bacilli bacterium]
MEKTICAISTNPGNGGAISIVRMSGPDSVEITKKIFSNKTFPDAPSHTIHYGYIMDKNEKIDEVLVMKMLSPKTYTTEDIIEINCHGGMSTTNKVLELLILNGAELAEPGEFTKRAFLNGRINLLEAEAVGDLIEAKNDTARALAMHGVTGSLTQLIQSLRDKIVTLLANIEVNIDYPEYEDEKVITHENILPELKEISFALQQIVKESENGKIIKEGINVAFIGRPNVGKSSLLNAFLEEEKAIVTNVSGTTRDIVEGEVILNGILLNLIDTAGIRETNDLVEKIGVDKSKKVIETADLVILVLNRNERLTTEDRELLSKIALKKNIIFLNKNDLEPKIDEEIYHYPNIVIGTTTTTEGLIPLKNKIIELFHLNEIESKDMNYLSNVRQITLAKKALENINNVEQQIKENIPIDILEIELKEAWNNLGLIIGATYEDELIDNLFQKFCLGK